MKASTRILLGLAILWFLGAAGVRAWGTDPHPGSCQSCTIDINSLANAMGWSVQYLVDESAIPPGYCCDQHSYATMSAEPEPDDNRGLALAPDGKHLYAGYNTGHFPQALLDGLMGEVRKIDTSGAVLEEKRFDNVLYGYRGKAIAVDLRSRIYLAEGWHELKDGPPDTSHRLVIYDADLDSQLFNFTIAAGVCPPSSFIGDAGDNCLPQAARPEGVAVTQSSQGLILYVSDRNRGVLYKFVSSNGKVTNWKFKGEFPVVSTAPPQTAMSLRGAEVDPMGRIWIADVAANGVFVVTWNDSNPLASSSTFVGGISGAIDVGFDAVHAFVTTNGIAGDPIAPPQIKVLDRTTLMVTSTLTPPYSSLNPPINPCGEADNPCGNDGARLSGIAVTCPIHGGAKAGFYVANEAGLTAQPDPADPPPNPLEVPLRTACGSAKPLDVATNTCDREAIIGALAGVFAPCAGCGKTSGGGQIAVTGGSASFGFNAKSKDGMFTGRLEYLDHATGANYHSMAITSLMVDMTGTRADFGGTIVKKGDSTAYYFKVHDEENGEGHPTQDVFRITICANGPCDNLGSVVVYSAGQTGHIKCGDIEVHQCKRDDD